MNDLIEGMVRKPDHDTSIAAALKVNRLSLQEIVIGHAMAAGGNGIIDDDLKRAYPEQPESSVRRRRTDLAKQNVLLDTGRTRLNQFGQREKVWVHRDFHHNPPPIIERQPTISKDHQIVILEAKLRAKNIAIRDALEAHHEADQSIKARSRVTDILTAALSA